MGLGLHFGVDEKSFMATRFSFSSQLFPAESLLVPNMSSADRRNRPAVAPYLTLTRLTINRRNIVLNLRYSSQSKLLHNTGAKYPKPHRGDGKCWTTCQTPHLQQQGTADVLLCGNVSAQESKLRQESNRLRSDVAKESGCAVRAPGPDEEAQIWRR